MSDRFLGTGQGAINLGNGTANIFAGSLSVAGLDPSQPVRTNSLRELVSSKLAISDINNLQGILNNVLSNPYVGTLEVDGLKTPLIKSTAGNVEITISDSTVAHPNGEVKINQNLVLNAELYATGGVGTPFVGGPLNQCEIVFNETAGLITTSSPNGLIANEFKTSTIKSIGGNVAINVLASTVAHPAGEVNFNSSATLVLESELYANAGIGCTFIGGLTNDDEIVFNEVAGMIEMRSDIVRTDQTVFNHDKDVASKKYVDDTLGGNVKTQNISATDTDATKTRMTKPLEMGGPVSFSSISTRLLTFTSGSGTVGWEFNMTQNVTITRLQISKNHISSHKTIYLSFFNVLTNTAVATTPYTTNQEDADYYYIDLATPYPMLVRDNLYRYALSVFLPTAEANNIQSASSTIPGATITDVYNRSNTGASWAFPTTKGAVDSMPIIEFRSSPTYPIGTENVKAYDVNVQHAYVNNAVIIGKTKDGFTNDNELVSKSYVDDLISKLPKATRLRIPKTPNRPPTVGNAVYEDEYIRLGWDQATASDLEIQRTSASGPYLSFCYRTATISEVEVFVANANQTYTLNNFGFNGGEIMECRLTPYDDNVMPAYHISIHFTESSTGTDGDLDWIITRYNLA